MRLRLKFKKEGPIRFVGHLDLMRTMQKTFRRAELPIAYSEGFSPHQIFSFAAALAVGVSSEAEYMDLSLTEEKDVQWVIDAVNHVAPAGIKIIEGVVIQSKEPKAMACLAAASYDIKQLQPIITETMIENLMASEEILVQKKTKKGKINTIDLKPGVLSIQLIEGVIKMVIATGSQMNVKPEMLLTYMIEQASLTYERGNFHFHRTELYHMTDSLKPLSTPQLG